MSDTTIEVKNIRKEFGKKHVRVVAIKDVSMKVEQGEIVLILGPSGSGKTTLLSMMGCIMTPTSGEIYIGGEKISEMSEKYLPAVRKKHIGFVFQSFNLLRSLTARENVEVALNLNGKKGSEAKQRAGEILTELGLGERLDFFPVDLSGGEKQRVSIARAIVNNPKIILADEPTGNLDSKTGQKIGKTLRNLAKEHKTSVIIVTHDNRIENIADRILYLEDGDIKDEKIISPFHKLQIPVIC
jgi:putative ABC transport system ATP-binding protein